MAELNTIFKRPFTEQLAAFRLRLGNRVPTQAWDDLRHSQHDRAFVVAGATKAELLADLGRAVDDAIAGGQTIEQFRASFREIVERQGWHGWTGEGTARGEAWRTNVIYRTNLRTSYMAGRRAQLTEGNFPLWVYRHGGSIEPRPQHLAWDGLVLPPDHPFFEKHYPPNDWGCSCRVFGARNEAMARRLGGDPDKVLEPGWDTPELRTGTPRGIGKGWDYAPGSSVEDAVRLASRTVRSLPPELGARYHSMVGGLTERAWISWLAETVTRGSHDHRQVGALTQGIVQALADRGRLPQTAELRILPGLVSGTKAIRHQEDGDALDMADWARLPYDLQNPTAVLYQANRDRYIFVLPGEGPRRVHLAVQLDGFENLALSPAGERRSLQSNYIGSARLVRPGVTRGRLNGGQIELVWGNAGDLGDPR